MPTEKDLYSTESKPCSVCHKVQPLIHYPRHGDCKDGHTNKCRGCTADYQRQKRGKPKVQEKPTKTIFTFRVTLRAPLVNFSRGATRDQILASLPKQLKVLHGDFNPED